MNLELLAETLAAEPAYRTRQVWEWAARGATSYAEMTNLPAPLRAELAERVPFSSLELAHEAQAKDGTVKALFHTEDGHPVEAVLMRYRDGRRSVCISSQSGCPLTCTFCATGQMQFRRNLTAGEILDQALHFRRLEPVNHVVFMGMGEPMLNIDAVLEAARRLPDLGVTHRRTTVSTVGWLPGLRRFIDEVDEPIRLALSLHAPTDALRSELMPVNDRYPLEDVIAECTRYVELRRRKVYVEYVMLAGVNDRLEHARARRPARPEGLQGEPDPVQPDRDVRGLGPRHHCRLQVGAPPRTHSGDGEADPRTRHRGRVRSAGGHFVMIAAPPPTVPDCVTQVAAPRHLMLACADGNFWLDGMTWRHWGAAKATGIGTAHANDCDPYCAAGHFHTYPVTVTIGGLRACTGTRRQYTKLVIRYTAAHRPGVGSPETVDLGCRAR